MPRKVVCACGQALAVPDQYSKPAARCSACGGTVPIPPATDSFLQAPFTAQPIDSPYAQSAKPAAFGEPTYAAGPRPVSNDSRVLWVILGLVGTATVLFCGCGGLLFYALGAVSDDQRQAERPPPVMPQPTFPQPKLPEVAPAIAPPTIPTPPPVPVPTPPVVTPVTPPPMPPPTTASNDLLKRRIYIPIKFKKLHIESLRKAQETAQGNERIAEMMQKNIARVSEELEREFEKAARTHNMTRAQIEEIVREGEEKKW